MWRRALTGQSPCDVCCSICPAVAVALCELRHTAEGDGRLSMPAMTDLSRAASRPMGPRQFAIRAMTRSLCGCWARPLLTPATLGLALLAAGAFAGEPRHLQQSPAAGCNTAADIVPASADALSDWTARANAVATEQREPPRSRARTLAIVNVAMFEAINAVERGDTPHKLNISADRNTSIEAAAAAAAHDVLVALYPDRGPDLSPALAASFARIANNVPKARGYALGKNAAAATLALWFSTAPGRKGDAILCSRP